MWSTVTNAILVWITMARPVSTATSARDVLNHPGFIAQSVHDAFLQTTIMTKTAKKTNEVVVTLNII